MEEVKQMTIEERVARLEARIMKPKNMLSFEEACEYTTLSRSTLYKLTSQKKIPFYKPSGHLLFFERTELDNWLRSNPVRTDEQLTDMANSYVMNHSYVP